nr:RQC domain-containing protein [Micropruina sp.]
MLGLCETLRCRRQLMLDYFGEPSQACGNCDTCLNPPTPWDGTIAAQKLLSTVVRLKRERNQRFGAGQLIDILHGRRTAKVEQWRHEQLSTFGIGTELTDLQWRAVVRQLLAAGILAVSSDGHHTLEITDTSWSVLRGERPVPLREDAVVRAGATRKRTASATAKGPAAANELTADDRELFERLRTWRSETARAAAVPAYVVFPDTTLAAIAQHRPTSSNELFAISGVGAKKLESYGDAVLAVVTGRPDERD